MAGFEEKIKLKTKEALIAIEGYLPSEEGLQHTILEACAYSVENGGKRLRPIFMQAAYELCGGSMVSEELYPFMAAMEMIHSSSLVHDDLPCMDNDRLRRGKPSTWAKYGEDMGTLTGDALMIYAFETAVKSMADPKKKLEAIKILAEKTGIFGMIGGQVVDVELTGKRPSAEQIEFIYKLKTGALIEASFMIGGIIAGADDETINKLEKAGSYIGMAFQIQDDILDVISSEDELGKPVNSDIRNEKITWLSIYGMEQSLKDVERFTSDALQLLSEIRKNDEKSFLEELCLYLINRKK
ncbi:MAG: polyprenyl synthetase family protein [Eubacteriales bacterium]|nr:polyprenyl synthetase family protein [Eubacteriales bacterium]